MNELFIGTIKDHKWVFNNRAHWQSWLDLKRDGQYILRPPTPLKDTRSVNANALYWLRNTQLSEATGYTKNEIHEYVMTQSGYFKETAVFDKIILMRESSAKLSTHEFSKLFDIQNEIQDQINDGMPDGTKLMLASVG